MQGERLGPYQVGRELGVGGMGTVYAATVQGRAPGLEAGAPVALKVVHPHLLETEGFFLRFMREARLGAAIRHPNVVRTHLVDAIGQQHFLVMEYVEGQNLRDLLKELERVPEELCRHVGREVARGLSAIHDAGILHRDLKPENVLITPEHVVKVMDLGVARLQAETVRLSQTGAFVGSLQYAAPEAFQRGGAEMDARADLHALGILLYELACGTNPYLAEDVTQTIHKVLHEEPRRLGDANPQLSPFFEEVVHCLLAKDREQRFASANELLSVLEEGEDSVWWTVRSRSIRVATSRPLRRIRIPRETAVYGRENELKRLHALCELAGAGDGQVVLIEGEAGIGKSRLVDELIRRLRHDGEDLNFLFGSYPPGGAALAAGGFSSAYREQLGSDGSAAYLVDTPLLAPGFDAVLRGEPAPEDAASLTRDSLETCFVHVTRALAKERTTVILIDDLHFAPEDARALFASLSRAVPGHRVLLLGTTRPGVPEEWIANLTRPEHVAHMHVGRLSPKDLALLLRDTFRSERLAEELGYKIALKSDGNPFFAFEIIRGLREGQFITQADDGTWVGTRVVDHIQIPSSVQDLVNARVADLSEDERALLDVAACWGFEFDPGLVGDVLGMSRIPALRAFGQIERRHRLVRAAGCTMVFDHHQVQEALYGSLLLPLREEYHAALAEALETRTQAAGKDAESLDGAVCVDLCEHFLRSNRGESALRYLEAAQTDLTKGYLHAHMVTLTERALSVPGLLTGVARAKTLLRLGGTDGPLDLLARRTRQEECVREAGELAEDADDQQLRDQVAAALGWYLYRTSQLDESAAVHRRALDLARGRGDRNEEARAAGSLGLVVYTQGRLAEAKEHLECARALHRELGSRRGAASATGNLGLVFWTQGRLPEAQEHLERHLALSREIGDRAGEARATGNLGIVFWSQGRLAEAQDYLDRHLALSHEIGDRHGEATATGNLGNVFTGLGRHADAREHFERYLALSREIGYRQGEALATGNLGNAMFGLGRLAEAKDYFERSLALSRRIGHGQVEALAKHNLGGVLREEGESHGSEEHLAACLELCERMGDRRLRAQTQLALGSLLEATRGPGRGRDALAEARSLSAEYEFAGVETLARCELALLPDADAQDALAAFTQHEERLDVEERREAQLLLWKATGDRTHLLAAKGLLDEHLALNPPEYHDSMRTNLRVNREILAAWSEE